MPCFQLGGHADSETHRYRDGGGSIRKFGLRIKTVSVTRPTYLPESEGGEILAPAQILDGWLRRSGTRTHENDATKQKRAKRSPDHDSIVARIRRTVRSRLYD